MKRIIIFIIALILAFLFFPFPKNLGPQHLPQKAEAATLNTDSFIDEAGETLFSALLPPPDDWPQPLFLLWRVVHLDRVLHSDKGDENWVKLDNIPIKTRQALIAIEDKRFYEHSGIDIDGILRATLANIQAGDVVQGGSTLTQQLVKNILLSSEQNMGRKFTEAVLALILEAHYSKEDILEMYFNTTYFGAGATGINEAAWTYFGKSPADLSLAESATIASLPYAPSALNPYENPDGCRKRRNLVLSTMFKNGFIDEAAASEAREQELILAEF